MLDENVRGRSIASWTRLLRALDDESTEAIHQQAAKEIEALYGDGQDWSADILSL